MNTLENFLISIDSKTEAAIRQVMGSEYIDTPGYWSQDKDTGEYADIFDFMVRNMGKSEFDLLVKWYTDNPKKVAQLMTF